MWSRVLFFLQRTPSALRLNKQTDGKGFFIVRKLLYAFVLLTSLVAMTACASDTPATPTAPTEEGQGSPDVPAVPEPIPVTPANPPSDTPPDTPVESPAAGEQPVSDDQVYQNDIFREVTVTKVGPATYEVKGQALIFEAVVDYVVEDGHNELTEGHVMASKGAPEWGDFSFTLHVEKAQPHSTLTLILYETSAKDGSRRMELPIPLPQ